MSTCGVSQYNTSSVIAPLHPIEISPLRPWHASQAFTHRISADLSPEAADLCPDTALCRTLRRGNSLLPHCVALESTRP